ncbi:MAG: diguanylate cyclase [Oscillospiraceae bacterium]|nr:diguanylate cyclase [Oscillospiraceae bacterium]
MKKHGGLTAQILIMVSLTAVLICACVTAVGSALIYFVTEDSIKSEVNNAARELCSLYDSDYHGEYYMQNGSLYKGGVMLSYQDFISKISQIACSDDVDFTVFWGDTRIFTSMKRNDGSYFIGTSADKKVSESVLVNGLEYYCSKVSINGKDYAGYYIPIVNSSAKTVGMIFAGRPLDTARSNMRMIIITLSLVSLCILGISMAFFRRFSVKLVQSLSDVSRFMENVANGCFGAELSHKTLSRTDEVGDIARSANTLRYNLRELVERDPLTSLFNRRSGRRAIDELISGGRSYTAAMADIDYFKRINDGFGHACGDYVLKELSALVREETEKRKGFVSRWGGEEFLIILPGKGISEARDFLEELLDLIRNKEFTWNGERLPVTVTAGAAEAKEGETPDETINRADHLLYDGKKSGRNRVVS